VLQGVSFVSGRDGDCVGSGRRVWEIHDELAGFRLLHAYAGADLVDGVTFRQ